LGVLDHVSSACAPNARARILAREWRSFHDRS
jgi:hypothetical protein